jgi:hypothetical protein
VIEFEKDCQGWNHQAESLAEAAEKSHGRPACRGESCSGECSTEAACQKTSPRGVAAQRAGALVRVWLLGGCQQVLSRNTAGGG